MFLASGEPESSLTMQDLYFILFCYVLLIYYSLLYLIIVFYFINLLYLNNFCIFKFITLD